MYNQYFTFIVYSQKRVFCNLTCEMQKKKKIIPLRKSPLLFFQWNTLSSSDITDAIAASKLTTNSHFLSLVSTSKPRLWLPVVPHVDADWLIHLCVRPQAHCSKPRKTDLWYHTCLTKITYHVVSWIQLLHQGFSEQKYCYTESSKTTLFKSCE